MSYKPAVCVVAEAIASRASSSPIERAWLREALLAAMPDLDRGRRRADSTPRGNRASIALVKALYDMDRAGVIRRVSPTQVVVVDGPKLEALISSPDPIGRIKDWRRAIDATD